MSWLFSRALVEEFSGESSSGGEPCAPLNVMPTPQPFWRNDKTMDVLSRSPFGLQWKPLTAGHGEELLTAYLEAFPARMCPAPGKGQESTGSDPVCSSTWQESLVQFDPPTSSWRTAHCLWEEDLPECSVRLHRWGMMRNGELWERTMPEHLTEGIASGLWPTPTTIDNPQVAGQGKAAGNPKRGTTLGGAVRMWPTPKASAAGPDLAKLERSTTGISLQTAVTMWPTPTAAEGSKIGSQANYGQKGLSNHPAIVGEPTRPKGEKSRKGEKTWPTPTSRDHHGAYRTESLIRENGKSRAQMLPNAGKGAETCPGGQLNPTWVEWLMGWPIGWTDLKPLEMDKFQQWQHSHSKF